MSKKNLQRTDAKTQKPGAPAKTGSAATTRQAPEPAPEPVPPLFRKIDWLAMALTFAIVLITYLLTLAPELTLRDSGELVTGSFYAGIPHPPGYPVWTIYSWLWTVILPFGSIAMRVAAGQAFSGAVACGLIALMVSRGSSMLMEGIQELKGMTGKWENAICLASGLTAGLLMGFDSFMWSESVVVNRIAVFSVPWLLTVLICLLRWIYAPHQMRYAYWALFLYGICITTHQSLMTASIAIEIIIALGNPRVGRDVFFFNFFIYLAYNLHLIVTGNHLSPNLGAKPGLLLLFHAIGLGSFAVACWLATKTKGILTEWKPVVIMGALWVLGVSFYFYMPIAGMTNPPMQWGYPRTVDGFFEALTRGQYEQPSPSNVFADPLRFGGQLWILVGGAVEEFTWVSFFLAIVPFFFLKRMQRRERAWIIGLSVIYFCVGVLLTILLNPSPERSSAELIKVFLISSHAIVALFIGYGLALTAAFMATHYERFRPWGLMGGGVAALLSVYTLWENTGRHYAGPAGTVSLLSLPHWITQAFAKNQYGLPIVAGLILVLITFSFVIALAVYRKRAPLLITLALYVAMPLYGGISHWFYSEQRGHMFGYWFGHDMFSPPFVANGKFSYDPDLRAQAIKGPDGKNVYPEITKDAILFGGTDPGRFCPTYIVFVESFTDHEDQPKEDQKFDRRDVYVITQNALANAQYLCYIRAHYNKSKQIQYDSPFFREFARTLAKDKAYHTNVFAQLLSPLDTLFTGIGDRVEKRRRTYTSWLKPEHFTDLPGMIARLRPGEKQDAVSHYVFEHLSKETQGLIGQSGAEAKVRAALATDLNRWIDGPSIYDTGGFAGVEISDYLRKFMAQNPQTHTRVRLNRLLLEAAYPKEIARSIGGVYPDREIFIPGPTDLQKAFDDYYSDVIKRMTHDRDYPNEAKQLRPGENVQVFKDKGGQDRLQVSGTTSIFTMNGLIAKQIFDENPENEFFVEESFPLDWMFPHLTPFGVIMKVNRQEVPQITDEVVEKDHKFWKEYSKRLTGDIIDYDTPVKDVVAWIEKTHLRHDLTGFTGSTKFVRDNDAQESFSKLRNSIAGIYAWRLGLLFGTPTPDQYVATAPADKQRMLREADFAFKQAFAFCPYSAEVVFRYLNILTATGRFDDAMLIAQTCLKMDPYSSQMAGVVQNLEQFKKQQGAVQQARTNLIGMEEELQKDPSNHRLALTLAASYLQIQENDRAYTLMDGILNDPKVDLNLALNVVQTYAQARQWQKVEAGLEKVVKLAPENPEVWYDLASLKAGMGKKDEALIALRNVVTLSDRRLRMDPKARDLAAAARKDGRFEGLRSLPEYQRIFPPQ